MSHWQQPHALDRCEGLRASLDWVADAWAHPLARIVGVDGEGRLDTNGDGLGWRPAEGTYDPGSHHLLGLLGEVPVFAVEVASATTELRSVMAQLSHAELQIAFTSVGLVGWHRRARFCPVCGSATVAVNGGAARSCSSCGLEDYPRSDPAVIVAVVDAEGRLLLARQPSWPAGRYSVLAGFTEVGESLEQTVHREIAEEAGITVGEISYLGSQPWPFPRSLMVAFTARATQTALRPAPGEIEDAAWYTRDELRVAMAQGRVELPSETSIARRMIEAWLVEDLTSAAVG